MRAIEDVADPAVIAPVQVRMRAHGRNRGAVTQRGNRRSRERAESGGPNIVTVTLRLASQSRTLSAVDFTDGLGSSTQPAVCVCIYGKPVLPFFIVFQLPWRQQPVFPNALSVGVRAHGGLAFGNDPIGCFQHFWQLLRHPGPVASEQIVLGERPQGPAMVQVVAGVGVVVLSVHPDAVKNGVGIPKTAWQ